MKAMYIIFSVIFFLCSLPFLIPMLNGSIDYRQSSDTEILGYIALTFLLVFLGGLFAILAARRRTHPRRLVCPNGCNIAQEGTKYCGLCGARLIQE